MASTIANYQGNGSTTDFNVPFDYLAKKFVKVTVDSREKLGGDYGDTTKDYFFVDKTTIRFNTAPASGTEIIIRRYTSATDRIVSFKDASVLKAKDLDVSTVQTIHIAEEGRDVINDALIVDKEGNWDARGHRIVNVGDPIGDTDAVSFKFYKDDAMGAYQAKLKAEAARDAAKTSETNAKTSEVNAKESEVTAKASAGTAVSAAKHADDVKTENQTILEEARQIQTNIETSENNAYENAVLATQKADEAKVSERNAKVSEIEAKRQADLAKGYAENAAGGQINSDWAEDDTKSKAFIRNKPDLSVYATTKTLTEGLAGKANSSHTHSIANVTDLQKVLDSKATNIALTEGLAGKEGKGVCLPLTGGTLTGVLHMTEDTHIYAVPDEALKGLELGGGIDYKSGASLFLRNNSATGEGESGQWGLASQDASSGKEGVLIGRADTLWFNGGLVERSNEIFGSAIDGGFYDVYRYATGLQIIIAGVTIPANQLGLTFTFPRPFINQSYSIAANAYTEYGDMTVTWALETTTSVKLYRKFYNGNYDIPSYVKCAFIGRWK